MHDLLILYNTLCPSNLSSDPQREGGKGNSSYSLNTSVVVGTGSKTGVMVEGVGGFGGQAIWGDKTETLQQAKSVHVSYLCTISRGSA